MMEEISSFLNGFGDILYNSEEVLGFLASESIGGGESLMITMAIIISTESERAHVCARLNLLCVHLRTGDHVPPLLGLVFAYLYPLATNP